MINPVSGTVTVNATLTLICSIDVSLGGLPLGRRHTQLVTLSLQQLDPSQTLNAFIRQRIAATEPAATSSFPDFQGIQPAGSVDADGNPTDIRVADLDVGGSGVIEVYGRQSGAGGSVRYVYQLTGPS